MRISLLLTGALLLCATPARAENEHVDDRDTWRAAFTLGGSVYAGYPGSISAAGPSLSVDVPLWWGHRYRFFQWTAGLSGAARVDTAKPRGLLVVGPQAGFDLYFGSVFGFELLIGLGAGGQIGARPAPALGLTGAGSYVFRPFKDDRQRLKLTMQMYGGAYLARDPGNDLGSSAAALGVGVGYETPL